MFLEVGSTMLVHVTKLRAHTIEKKKESYRDFRVQFFQQKYIFKKHAIYEHE